MRRRGQPSNHRGRLARPANDVTEKYTLHTAQGFPPIYHPEPVTLLWIVLAITPADGRIRPRACVLIPSCLGCQQQSSLGPADALARPARTPAHSPAGGQWGAPLSCWASTHAQDRPLSKGEGLFPTVMGTRCAVISVFYPQLGIFFRA